MALTSENSPLPPILIWFSSKKLCLLLIFTLIVVLIPASLSQFFQFKLSFLVNVLLTCLTLNIITCSLRKWQKLSIKIKLIHIGIILIFLGGLIGASGYISTVNIHGGSSSSTAYRWDCAKDVELGFTLKVNKIHREYYPIPVKIGVLKNGKRAKLFEIKTGDSFSFDGYAIKVLDISIEALNASLEIHQPDGAFYHYETSNLQKNNPKSPLDFQLVAFQDPILKKTWVDLEIIDAESNTSIKGVTSINNPFQWNGLKFYQTETGKDPAGISYAGIQIVNDPGVPMVYLGFLLTFTGCMLLLF